MDRCENCQFYQYDEEYDDYFCDAALDEDDMARFVASQTRECPFWRPSDDYRTARRQ
ncbi:MAG: hypothetical protein IJT78_03350 [Oscillospiraceae bacterium]|nr:hypothetical protein [Oscillospiraceae bacterium]